MGRWIEQEVMQRATAAEQVRAKVLPSIRETLEYTMPWRSDRRRAGDGMDRLFDSTGPSVVQKFSGRLQRDYSPPFQRWFEFEAGPLVPEDQQEAVNRELEVATKVAHAVLDASAFPTASAESYADLCIGTGALLGSEGDDNTLINWISAPAWALAIEEGPTGRIDNTYWRKKFPAWILPRHWPRAEWPTKIAKMIADRSVEQVEVMQATYFDPELRRWRLHVLCCEGGGGHTTYDSDRDRTNPWTITRYWTTPGDPWGRGPAMLALADIKTANKTVEMILKAAAFQLAPPLMVQHDGVINPDTIRLAPQALIQVARTGGPMGPSIAPMELGQRVDMGHIVLEDLRTSIKQTVPGASQLPPLTGAVRSASEIIERAKDLAYDTGAAFGRLNHENAPQVVARVLDVCDRKKIPFMSWNDLRIDQLIMKVKVTSPIARAQSLEDVQTTVQFWELAKSIGGEAAFIQIANTEEGLPKLAKLMGVPLWAVNSPERRTALAKAAGEMAAQVAANEDQPGGSAGGVQNLLGMAG